MLKAEKKLAVQELKNIFSNNSSVIVFHYKGLTVEGINSLKSEMKKSETNMRVVKNTLSVVALRENKNEDFVDLFKGPTAIAWGNSPVEIAKVLYGFAKKNNNLILIGGIYDGKKLNKKDVELLASMPSLDELKSKLIAVITTPAANIARLLQKPASMVAAVLDQYSKK